MKEIYLGIAFIRYWVLHMSLPSDAYSKRPVVPMVGKV
jgi:hypothetical protein